MSKSTRADEAASYGLLGSLNETPIKPKEPSLPLESTDERTLGVAREKQLTDDFAFISAVGGDTDQVTAVCIEEHHDGFGMNLCISSNTSLPTSLHKDFRRLAELLQMATKRSKHTIRSVTFPFVMLIVR